MVLEVKHKGVLTDKELMKTYLHRIRWGSDRFKSKKEWLDSLKLAAETMGLKFIVSLDDNYKKTYEVEHASV